MLHLPEMELKKTRFYQEVFGEGHQEGRQEGWQEGRQGGVADTLLRQVTAKFGPPPACDASSPGVRRYRYPLALVRTYP
jgi:hypothetical protein